MKNASHPSDNTHHSLDGNMHWYFAYGSNLCVDQMRARVGAYFYSNDADPELTPRVVTLPNHRFDFSMLGCNGCYYANIVAPGDGVMGVIYRCHEQAFLQLDAYESGYDRRPMIVCDSTYGSLEAMVYIARPESTSFPGIPAADYVETILRGGGAHGLPNHYLRTIKEAARRSNHQRTWLGNRSD